MKRTSNTFRNSFGFTLAEMLAALLIAAMVLVTVISIYSRAEDSAAAITSKLDRSRLGYEVLQRIAEDLDRIVTPDSDTKIRVDNKFNKQGFPTARLTITRTVQNKRFEEIVWQSGYDYDSDANNLVLYRSYSGMGLEDKLLDESKEDWERELLVPICTGVTFFRIEIQQGRRLVNGWTSDSLPHGIVATISFAEPFKNLDNTLDVLDEEKVTRTIALDRTRKIRFTIVKEKESK